MSKRPPKKGPSTPFTPGPVMRPTVPLPGMAGGFRPTIPLPGSAMPAVPRAPSSGEIAEALRKAAGLYAAKHFGQAEEIARLILRFVPRQADALHLLGLIVFAKGDAAESERLISTALAASKPHPNLLVNLGNAQRQQGKIEAALASYNRALKIDAVYADAYVERGELLAAQQRFSEALQDYEMLITLRSAEIAPYLRAATAASDLGDFRLALAYCDRALPQLDPQPLELLTMIAMTHERLSELPEAISWAEKALARDPQNANALRVWAKARRRIAKRDPQRLAEIHERLSRVNAEAMSASDARVIYAEMANVCDELGNVDEAFVYFMRQNEKTFEFSKQMGVTNEAFLEDVDKLIEVFTPAFISSWQAIPDEPPVAKYRAAPVFLVGFPRSGTTLLDQILDSHDEVQVIEERPLLRAAKVAADALPGGYPLGLAPLTAELRRHVRSVYWAEVEKEGVDVAGKIIVDKMPLNIVHIGLVQRIFPEAKIILALRHPADVVLSCFMQDFIPNGAMANFLSLDGAARLYDRVMTLWQQYRTVLPLNVVEVRYENLIRDLRGEVEPVIDFLGLTWNAALSDPAAHALARGTIRTPSYAQVTQPIYGTAADRWRRYEKHLAPVLPLLEKHIRHFGYQL